MFDTSDFRNGLKIEVDGTPYEIIWFQHHKPGKGGAVMRTKLRNLLNGRVVENTFRAGEKVGKPDLAQKEMQFLYRQGEDFVFMDMESYEQVNVPEEKLAGKGGFMKEGDQITTLQYKGDILDLDLPAAVNLKITHTEPGIQGDRVSGATKPATVETGLEVKVPLFVNEGDVIKIDTRSGDYISRV